MRKILLVSLQKFGGGAIDTLGLSNGLCVNKIFHYLIISRDNELAEGFIDNEFRKVFKIKTFKSSFLDFFIQTFLFLKFLIIFRILFQIKPDIVLTTHFHPWIIFIFISKIFLKYKIFYGVHDNPFDPKEEGPPFSTFLERVFVKHSDVIITYSKFIKEDIKKYLPNKRIEIVYLGNYKDLFPNFRKSININKKNLTLLFLGRVLPYKGLDILIKAIEILKGKGLKIQTIIAGRGELDKESFEKIKKFEIDFENRWLSNDELLSFLEKGDILIMPYKKGTQSGVISLALAYGIPVIATKVGSFGEFIKDGVNGFLVNPNNPEALAEKIEKIYFDRKILLDMSTKASKIAEKFSWENTVKDLIKLLG